MWLERLQEDLRQRRPYNAEAWRQQVNARPALRMSADSVHGFARCCHTPSRHEPGAQPQVQTAPGSPLHHVAGGSKTYSWAAVL